MSDIQTFNASRGASTGTSGFRNYIGTPDVEGTLAQVFAKYPRAVVVDGNDDWFAPIQSSPARACRKNGITPLAYFHTGISGISKSGVVLKASDYRKLCKLVIFSLSVRIYRKAK